MLDLSPVTLFCADCVDTDRAERIMRRCTDVANFGAVKLLTSLPTSYQHRVEIPPITSHNGYSIWMLKRAYLYIDTPKFLVVQHDGYIINASAWDPAWLQYDYIGPLFIQRYVPPLMGTGGFSLRSKTLMQYVNARLPDWDGSDADAQRLQAKLGSYEDGVIAIRFREELIAAGYKFAPVHEAVKFAQGGLPVKGDANDHDTRYYCERPFGFHGGWSNMNWDTGFVSPPPFKAGGQ